jgi:hypothetical protein
MCRRVIRKPRLARQGPNGVVSHFVALVSSRNSSSVLVFFLLLALHCSYARDDPDKRAITMASTAGDDDPFRDPLLAPAAPAPQHPAPTHSNDAPDTLAVGRNASLTLGTDSLVVLGREERPKLETAR